MNGTQNQPEWEPDADGYILGDELAEIRPIFGDEWSVRVDGLQVGVRDDLGTAMALGRRKAAEL